jgi:hypothetical protein
MAFRTSRIGSPNIVQCVTMVERTGRTTNHLCCSKRTWTKEDTRAATAFVKTRVTSHLALTRSRRRSRRSPFGQSRCSTALQTPAESVSKGTSRPAPLRCSQTACRRTTEEQAEQISIPGHHCTMLAKAHDEKRTFLDVLHVLINYVHRRRRSHPCPLFVPSVNGLARALKNENSYILSTTHVCHCFWKYRIDFHWPCRIWVCVK